MAIYHCSLSLVSRAKGQSAIAAAAYRGGVKLFDERTAQIVDYRRRHGVISAEIVLPRGCHWRPSIGELWNKAEATETRKNSTVAREYEIAIPCELTSEQKQQLAVKFAQTIADRYQIAAMVAIHAPNGTKQIDGLPGGDARNHHAHILTTTRQINSHGQVGEKTRILDSAKTGALEVLWIRQTWAEMANAALMRAGIDVRLDHRSLKDQGVKDRLPGKHIGVHALEMARKGTTTDRVSEWRAIQVANVRLAAAAAEVHQMDQQVDALSQMLVDAKKAGVRERLGMEMQSIDISGNLSQAKDAQRAMTSIRVIRTELQAQALSKVKEKSMDTSSIEKPAVRLPSLPRLQGKRILGDWIDQLSISEDQGRRLLAIAIFNNLFDGVVEKAGYRDRLKAWHPDEMAEFEQYEASQARYDEIKAMDPGKIVQLPTDERRYLECLRQLPADTTLDDIRLMDEDIARKMRVSSRKQREQILTLHSPASLIAKSYVPEVIAKAETPAQERKVGNSQEWKQDFRMSM